MARLFAIDFDRIEARYVLASPKGHRLKIHAAGSVPLPESTPEAEQSPASSGELLRTALTERGLRPAAALVGVDRTGIELLHLALPPASNAELPELVANQVLRESHLAGEQSVIDFVPISDNPAEPRQVMAAVLPPEKLHQIEAFCAGAGLKPKRMVLRSHAAASLFLRTATAEEEICLLINPVGEEVDLTVLVDRKAVFSRTARLPDAADEPQTAGRLVDEIKRTLAVAMQSELGTDQVECIYVFGQADEHQDLLSQIREALGLPAKVFDPFAAVGVFRAMVPERSGRFGSLLGMLLDEAHLGAHTIDFLHPRRQPRRITLGQIAVAAAGLLVIAGLAIGAYYWKAVADVNAENERLTSQLKEYSDRVKKAKAQKKLLDTVEDWQAGDVSWLDELRELSIKFPPRRDAVVLHMSISSVPGRGGGTISFQGLVRDPSFVFLMEDNIRDEKFNTVSGKRVQEGGRQQDYAVRFDTSMFVTKRRKEEYTRHLGERAAVGQKKPRRREAPSR